MSFTDALIKLGQTMVQSNLKERLMFSPSRPIMCYWRIETTMITHR
jgi:hypothetical protein